jgi:hypothetical protein
LGEIIKDSIIAEKNLKTIGKCVIIGKKCQITIEDYSKLFAG